MASRRRQRLLIRGIAHQASQQVRAFRRPFFALLSGLTILAFPLAPNAAPRDDIKRLIFTDCDTAKAHLLALASGEQENLVPFLAGALNVGARPPPEPLRPFSTIPPLGQTAAIAWQSLPSERELRARRCAATLLRALGPKAVVATGELYAAATTREPLPTDLRSFLDTTLLELLGATPDDQRHAGLVSKLLAELRADQPELAVAAISSIAATMSTASLIAAFPMEEAGANTALLQTLRLLEAVDRPVSSALLADFATAGAGEQERVLLLAHALAIPSLTIRLAVSGIAAADEHVRAIAAKNIRALIESLSDRSICESLGAHCALVATWALQSLWDTFTSNTPESAVAFDLLRQLAPAIPNAEAEFVQRYEEATSPRHRTALIQLLGSAPFNVDSVWPIIEQAAKSGDTDLRQAALVAIPRSTASSAQVLKLSAELVRLAPAREPRARRDDYLLEILRFAEPFINSSRSAFLLPVIEELIVRESPFTTVDDLAPAPLRDTIRAMGSPALPIVRAGLRHRLPIVQRRSLALLTQLPAQGRIVTDVAPFLSSTDEGVRELALTALGRADVLTSPALLTLLPRLRPEIQEHLGLLLVPYHPTNDQVLTAAQRASARLRCGRLTQSFRALIRLPGAPIDRLEAAALRCLAEGTSKSERIEAAQAIAELSPLSPNVAERLGRLLSQVVDSAERIALYEPILRANIPTDRAPLEHLVTPSEPNARAALDLLRTHRFLSTEVLDRIIESDAPLALRCSAANDRLRLSEYAPEEVPVDSLIRIGPRCATYFTIDALRTIARTLGTRDDSERIALLYTIASSTNGAPILAELILPYRASPHPALAAAALLALASVAPADSYHDELRRLCLTRGFASLEALPNVGPSLTASFQTLHRQDDLLLVKRVAGVMANLVR